MASIDERFNQILNNAQTRYENNQSVNERFNNIINNVNNNKSLLMNTRRTFNTVKRNIPEYIQEQKRQNSPFNNVKRTYKSIEGQLPEYKRQLEALRKQKEEENKQKSQQLKEQSAKVNQISKKSANSYEQDSKNNLLNSSSKYNNKGYTTEVVNANNVAKKLNVSEDKAKKIMKEVSEKPYTMTDLSKEIKNSSWGNTYPGIALRGSIDAVNNLGSYLDSGIKGADQRWC